MANGYALFQARVMEVTPIRKVEEITPYTSMKRDWRREKDKDKEKDKRKEGGQKEQKRFMEWEPADDRDRREKKKWHTGEVSSSECEIGDPGFFFDYRM